MCRVLITTMMTNYVANSVSGVVSTSCSVHTVVVECRDPAHADQVVTTINSPPVVGWGLPDVVKQHARRLD